MQRVLCYFSKLQTSKLETRLKGNFLLIDFEAGTTLNMKHKYGDLLVDITIKRRGQKEE